MEEMLTMHGMDLARMFPDLEYHVWDGLGGATLGYFIMMEQPDRRNASIAAFMDRVR